MASCPTLSELALYSRLNSDDAGEEEEEGNEDGGEEEDEEEEIRTDMAFSDPHDVDEDQFTMLDWDEDIDGAVGPPHSWVRKKKNKEKEAFVPLASWTRGVGKERRVKGGQDDDAMDVGDSADIWSPTFSDRFSSFRSRIKSRY